jgi:hypothetical protein
MLDNKFRSFEDDIQREMENKIFGLEIELHKMEARLQEIEKNNPEQKQSPKEEEVDDNNNLTDKIREL